MIKKITSIAGLTFLILGLNGCYFDFDDDDFCRHGSGIIVTQSRGVAAFTGIENYIDADIKIKQGASSSIIVEANDNIIDDITTYVEGHRLIIDSDHCFSQATVKITITSNAIIDLVNYGSARIYANEGLNGDHIYLNLEGSGQIEALVNSNRVDVDLTGSGTIDLAGETANADLFLSGSGRKVVLGWSPR